ncbi:MAG TPA: alpha/beta hydrolase [Caulobacteraceae bacterium]|jgi:acetyl esterase/lipase
MWFASPRLAGALAAVSLVAGVARGAPTKAPLMDWPDLMGRPLPQPTKHIAYGPDPLQFGELWVPEGKGPFPTVVMVHGGCWLSGVAKLSIMNYAAEDLRRRGFAVWNVEYRGVDRPGGGYPGTFQDVAAAADDLLTIAKANNLRTDRVLALGHSAGGHLALWLAARARLPAGSPLKTAKPLPIFSVVSLGGLPDLASEAGHGVCGEGTVARLVGSPNPTHPDVYADTSPADLGAGNDREVLISGADDPLATPAMADAYAAKMKAKGAFIRSFKLKDTGHVELISPGTLGWSRAVDAVASLIGPS